MMQWARNQGYLCDAYTRTPLTRGMRLDVSVWAIERGRCWDQEPVLYDLDTVVRARHNRQTRTCSLVSFAWSQANSKVI